MEVSAENEARSDSYFTFILQQTHNVSARHEDVKKTLYVIKMNYCFLSDHLVNSTSARIQPGLKPRRRLHSVKSPSGGETRSSHPDGSFLRAEPKNAPVTPR